MPKKLEKVVTLTSTPDRNGYHAEALCLGFVADLLAGRQGNR